MAKNNPEPHFTTSFESSSMNYNVSAGVPDLELALILKLVDDSPGMTKSQCVDKSLHMVSRTENDARLFLRYVDALVHLNYLSKNEFKYYITPQGKRQCTAIVSNIYPALKRLVG
jgi:hypothetical protein